MAVENNQRHHHNIDNMGLRYHGSVIPTGSNLVLPSPNGMAYMGQLALDLMIATFKMKRIGYLDSLFVSPLVGSDPFNGNMNNMCSVFEVYQFEHESLSYIFIQLRASGFGSVFIKELSLWIKESNFSSVTILTGLDSAFLSDMNLLQDHFGYMSSENGLVEEQDKFSRLECSTNAQKVITREGHLEERNEHSFKLLSPGAGLTNLLLKELITLKLKWMVLTWYTGEGDNSGAARIFSDRIAHVLFAETNKINWSIPHSWEMSMASSQNTSLDIIY